jgi:hypothetical protein
MSEIPGKIKEFLDDGSQYSVRFMHVFHVRFFNEGIGAISRTMLDRRVDC